MRWTELSVGKWLVYQTPVRSAVEKYHSSFGKSPAAIAVHPAKETEAREACPEARIGLCRGISTTEVWLSSPEYQENEDE